jgi:anti-sigma regulatory factor (Ser/Thr protein kinase)
MRASKRFRHDTSSVPQARRFVTRFLAESGVESQDLAEMMVSELATNCLLHTGSDFTVSLEQRGHRLRVEVSDQGEGRPVLRPTDPTSVSGRGLRAIDILSDSWGVDTRPDSRGKTVWFTLNVPPLAREA